MRAFALLLVLMLSWPPVAAADALEEIVALARAGAPGLALHLLDGYQSTADPDGWMSAERERVHILELRGQWGPLAERYRDLPEGLPRPFLDWRAERQAEALLHLGDGAGALALLRALAWDTGAPDEETLRRWRASIVRAWLAAGDLDSALVALRRYSQDYGQDDAALRALHGEVLILAGRPAEAVAALGDGDDTPIRDLRWLARLHADGGAAAEIFEQAVQAGSARDASPVARRAAWRIAAEAASRLGNRAARVSALERGLAMSRDADTLPASLRTTPGQLWQAYLDWGRALGNAEQLIVGIDQDWLDAADALVESEPAAARALHVALATDTHAPAVAQYAHFRFARSLSAEPGGEVLLAALYLDEDLFPDPEAIPAPIRYALVDEVLRDNDIELASRLIADLEAPPSGIDPRDWAMRRARVLVLAGRGEEGFAVLDDMVARHDDYDVDRLLQVLFDMQSAEVHEHALALFARVAERDDIESQRRRELLFWMADSQRALGAHAEAARLYLRSATLVEPYAMDPWAQTARYQAAGALASAGLREDAVVLLQSLLNATEDPGRRAVLRHQIDQYSR